ncbi:MAG: hypothetical protein ABI306_03040, partial [Caulobacteraceae bacterium]
QDTLRLALNDALLANLAIRARIAQSANTARGVGVPKMAPPSRGQDTVCLSMDTPAAEGAARLSAALNDTQPPK